MSVFGEKETGTRQDQPVQLVYPLDPPSLYPGAVWQVEERRKRRKMTYWEGLNATHSCNDVSTTIASSAYERSVSEDLQHF